MSTIKLTSQKYVTQLLLVDDLGTGACFRSLDFGATWAAVSKMPSLTVNSVSFPSPSLGVACGAAGIYRTTDGGMTWATVATTGVGFNDIVLLPSGIGWCVGGSAVVLQTKDGGVTWAAPSGTLPSIGTTNLTGVAAANDKVAWIVGAVYSGNTVIINTTDGGATFARQGATYTMPLGTVACWDTQNVIVSCSTLDSSGRYSLNGGSTWNDMSGLSGVYGGYGVHGSLLAPTATLRVMAVSALGANVSTLYRSTNKGLNWSAVTALPTGYQVNNMVARGNVGYLNAGIGAYNGPNVYYTTTDGFATLQPAVAPYVGYSPRLALATGWSVLGPSLDLEVA